MPGAYVNSFDPYTGTLVAALSVAVAAAIALGSGLISEHSRVAVVAGIAGALVAAASYFVAWEVVPRLGWPDPRRAVLAAVVTLAVAAAFPQ